MRKRIEYQQLQTAKELQHQQTVYTELSFLPPSRFFTITIMNTKVPHLRASLEPLIRIPISAYHSISRYLQACSRVENLQRSKLQEEIVDWDEVKLKSADLYTSTRRHWPTTEATCITCGLLDENKSRARDVYRVVSLQYNQGIVAYLNLIVAESNLITAEIGYVNAFFQLLSSKIDLEKAMGEIPSHY